MPYRPPDVPLPAWLQALGGGTLIFAIVLGLVVIVIVMTLLERV